MIIEKISCYRQTPQAANKDSSKCTKTCGKLGTAFESKAKTKAEGSTHMEDTLRLVTEKIEKMLRVVLRLVRRKQQQAIARPLEQF